MADNTNSLVVKQRNEIVQKLTNNLDVSLDAVKEALPGDFNKARFLQNTVAVFKASPNLLQYNQTEVLTECLKASYLGLDFMNKEAWLVPYGNHVQFQLGYKGACKFVKKYSIRPIQDIYAKVVRKGDDFEYGDKDGKQYLNWKPVPFSGSDPIGFFACIQFVDGGVLYEVMSKEEVDKIRRRSKAGGSGPWVTDYEQMALKTVLKRICKNVETDFDNIEQRNAWDSDNAEFEQAPAAEVVDPFADNNEVEVEAEVEATVIDIPDVPNFA